MWRGGNPNWVQFFRQRSQEVQTHHGKPDLRLPNPRIRSRRESQRSRKSSVFQCGKKIIKNRRAHNCRGTRLENRIKNHRSANNRGKNRIDHSRKNSGGAQNNRKIKNRREIGAGWEDCLRVEDCIRVEDCLCSLDSREDRWEGGVQGCPSSWLRLLVSDWGLPQPRKRKPKMRHRFRHIFANFQNEKILWACACLLLEEPLSKILRLEIPADAEWW